MRNLQKETDKIVENLICKPKLMLHSCCAPCSTYVIDYLKKHFELFVFYYNPNIAPYDEYKLRLNEIKRLCEYHEVNFLESNWDNEIFNNLAKPFANEKEGGKRCDLCFELRLRKTFEIALKYGCEYFTTTLSISPLKNSLKLTEIGENIANISDIKYLPSDFKKRDGYKKSTIMSKELSLYRQDFCGCVYSKLESEKRKLNSKTI